MMYQLLNCIKNWYTKYYVEPREVKREWMARYGACIPQYCPYTGNRLYWSIEVERIFTESSYDVATGKRISDGPLYTYKVRATCGDYTYWPPNQIYLYHRIGRNEVYNTKTKKWLEI